MIKNKSEIPLAERLRPQTIEAFIGQSHLMGEKGSLKPLLEREFLPSMIFWGPPGVGKTTLAQLIAKHSGRSYEVLSAVQSGVKDVRAVIKKAEDNRMFQTKTPLLFIDEIHRFSKSQQDALLNAVEKGTLILIGATTENPSFEVISALLSRCQVFVLQAHDKSDLESLLHRALAEDDYFSQFKIELKETAVLLQFSGGDARRLLNAFEYVLGHADLESDLQITDEFCREILKHQPNQYDKNGEMHYDIVSALIKSIRGSDPNAAVYWLARMIDGGEDPKFIARRLIISASEDIGNANPTALIMANACFSSIQTIGMPEGRIILSQCVVYLANSEKSNASYMAINQALREVRDSGSLPVPLSLRNAPSQLMKNLNYGKDYKYSHNYPNQFVQQEFMPKALSKKTFYKPGNNPRERPWLERLKVMWKDWYSY